jgi:hypothetical protein
MQQYVAIICLWWKWVAKGNPTELTEGVKAESGPK